MKVSYHTLGCKVNQYETEIIRESFENRGYETAPFEQADIYIINTCSVTHLADRKSRQYIRKARKENPEAVIVVTGCYPQVSLSEVLSMNEVDIITGTNEKYIIPDLVEKYLTDKIRIASIRKYEELGCYIDHDGITSMGDKTRAYIKIQEGCNRFCSYCIIPYARGPVRSRAVQSILSEAVQLIESGYKEIVLTGINTALYGTETDFRIDSGDSYADTLYGIESIIYLLNKMPGNFRIRLSSLEPTVVDKEYVMRLLKYEKLCHHLHLSLQSGSDTVLRRMNRHYTATDYLDIVQTLRQEDPYYSITTDIIVGFPGETEEEFQDTMTLVSKADFLKVHVFQYSVRSGTNAAKMLDQIDARIKKSRSDMLISSSEESTKAFLTMNLGTTKKVLLEEYDTNSEYVTGYTDNYIRIYIKCDPKTLNQIVDVRLDSLYEDGVLGTLV